MGADRERVADKLVFIEAQVAAIDHLLSSRPRQEILADPWVERGLRYALQTAIEAVIDIGYHVCARVCREAPANARIALGRLAEAGLLSRDEVETYTRMVGFRNRLVHGYTRVAPEQVYEAAVSGLGDFGMFVESIKRLLERDNGGSPVSG